jgi:hypothetical protein
MVQSNFSPLTPALSRKGRGGKIGNRPSAKLLLD